MDVTIRCNVREYAQPVVQERSEMAGKKEDAVPWMVLKVGSSLLSVMHWAISVSPFDISHNLGGNISEFITLETFSR
ncbi:hypothetical protein PNOK_0817700 [Pyrrhoderma noxium]|uniref:Uncharacterized protein n=1 Tax=Pyrrhoderma noxium TaxID=2282107 RepID=A0A286UAF8_9AGAM|nr:hypothetical protein PNOK_0817700 [Pyrrhoderma noxium]